MFLRYTLLATLQTKNGKHNQRLSASCLHPFEALFCGVEVSMFLCNVFDDVHSRMSFFVQGRRGGLGPTMGGGVLS